MRLPVVFAALTAFAWSQSSDVEAASRSDYTKKQQQKLHSEGLRICQKKLGDRLANIKVD